MGPAIRGESGRGEVRDDVDVDFVAMLLRGETRVHDGDRASGAEATPAAGPWADYRLRLTLDQWTPDGAVSGEITDITRLRLRFRSDYGTVTAFDGSAVPQTQDLFRPLPLAVHRDDGSGIDGSTADTSRVVISVVAERLDTPVRIPDTPDATGRRGMRFFADPELAYERGTFYLFATTDGHSEWSGWQIHCLASEDLTHWQDRGVVIDLHDQHLDGSGRTNILPGRTAHAWVPAFAVRDGRYYLYFCGDGQANVAVSDHIDGGYALQGDLARTSSHAARHGFGTGIVAPGIDPAAFRDPQAGRWYLAWGQNRARYSRLSDDMLHIIPEATPDIREAAYLNVREHAGTWTYYLTYSIGDANDPDYRVAYAAASTMEGDGSQWTYRGEILVANERLGILGTGHHCILRVPGTDEWVIAYHCFLPDAMRPRGVDRYAGGRIRTGNKREIRFARLEFDERGGWRAAHQTGDGIDEQPGVVMNSGDMRGGEHVIGWQRCREDDKTVADMR